ncbi:hypothetical protein [Actinomadura miaoliensis]|uniref:Uncharacterized protein n=1 Tax=Actinomadura miaoliensis TaxID=430685 RepID=A0ABP7V5J0_9ACTN
MPTYPPIAAGQRITAGLLTAMLPNVIVKPSTTGRASTTTLTLDPDLQTTLAPGAQYFVEFHLQAAAVFDGTNGGTGGSGGDFRTSWTTPTGASGLKGVMGPSSNAQNNTADRITARMGVHVFNTSIIYAGVRSSNANAFYVHEWGVVTTTNGGTFGLNWAQGVSNATATQLFGNSTMIVRRVA